MATPEKSDEPPEPDRPPSAPRNLTLTPGDGKIDVSWDPPADLGKPEMRDRYFVELRRAGRDRWESAGEHGGTSATIDHLVNGVEYEVRVVVFNTEGEAVAGPMRATPAASGGDDGGGDGDANQPPTANAGLDQSVTVGSTVTLDGSGTDPEGETLSYAWTAPSGITLSSSAVARPTFTAPDRDGDDYTLTFSLVVNDGANHSAPDTVVISVTASEGDGDTNQPPTAHAGPDQSVTVGATVTLAGSGTDPEGESLSYAWTAPSGITLSSNTVAGPTFTAPDRDGEDYTLTFSLVVNDGASDSTPDTVVISVTVPEEEEPDPERAPTAPRNLSLTAGDEKITVSWSEPSDIGEPDDWLGYTVEIREVGESDWFEWGFYEGTSATIEDILENGVEYQVRVIAFNLWGEAASGVKSATPTAG